MAVPKKRTGKSAQAKRRANWKATVPATTKCTKCGAVVLTHTVCPECGSYKGKVVSIKHPEYKSEVEEAKKENKPKTKKVSNKKEETKSAVEEVKAETNADEAKTEAAEENKEEKPAE